jgi:hypothetical protein
MGNPVVSCGTMMEIRDDPRLLSDAIQTASSGLVVLDGANGAGKTCLANLVSKLSSCEVIHADCYIEHHQDRYIPSLQAESLNAAIQEAFTRSPIVLLEGICARDILDQVRFTPKLVVYVQRNSSVSDLPCDLEYLDEEDDPVDPYQPSDQNDPLEIEIASYHRRRKPKKNADILYIRVEQTGPD